MFDAAQRAALSRHHRRWTSPSPTWPSLQWTTSPIPTVANVEVALGTLISRQRANWAAILCNSSASSALQYAHGNWEATFLSLAKEVGPSI